jgi:hypothetical protein
MENAPGCAPKRAALFTWMILGKFQRLHVATSRRDLTTASLQSWLVIKGICPILSQCSSMMQYVRRNYCCPDESEWNSRSLGINDNLSYETIKIYQESVLRWTINESLLSFISVYFYPINYTLIIVDICTINHSYWSYWHQLSQLWGTTNCNWICKQHVYVGWWLDRAIPGTAHYSCTNDICVVFIA